MQIDNEFTVSVPIDQAWAVLTDLEGIAPCMPGAKLTGVEGDVYSGRVKVKVGPVTSEYAGTAQFSRKDDAGHHAVIDAKGRDARGAGNASALITAQLRPDGDRTVVSVSTDLRLTGRIAQFGSGMIKEVSAKLLGQFVECLEGKLAAPAPPAPSAAPPAAGFHAGEAAPAAGTAPAAPAPAPGGTSAPGTAPAGTPPAPGRTSASGTPPAGAVPASGTAPAGPAPAAGAAPAASMALPSSAGRAAALAEDAHLDLMKIAGASIYKRVIPLLVVLLVIIGVILYFALR